MEASNANILHQIPQLAEQAVQAALLLETRYNDQSAADAEGIDDDGMVVIASAVLEGEENEVKAKLINLLRCYEECVNESGRKCAIDFNYARREFQQLFDIWTKIRKVYDIVKYASIWDVTSPNGGEPSLEEVHRQISETFLQHLFKAHMPLFNEAIRKLNNDTMHYRNDHPQVEPQHQGFLVPEDEGDSQAQLIYQQFDSVLDFFRDSVDRVKNGSLSVWRREQKKAMLGIGLKADMAQDLSVTRPAIALKNATLQFQDLAKIWMQIDRLLFMFCSCKSSPYIPILQKSEGCAHYLLQSSLVVDWRYQNLCQPHIVVRASTTENVTIIVKILAACDGFRTAEGLVPPFINLKESRIAAAFVKPVQMAVGLNEEIARQLSDDEIEQRASFIERAGNITHRNNSAAGVLQSNLEVDSQDKTAHALFDDVTFVLPGVRKPDPRRRKGTQQRNACTKYHIDVIANIVLNTAQTTSFIELKTISSPFSYSVAKEQDKKIYRSFVWNLLGSDPDSVSCHCQPLPSDAAKDLSLVYWGDYKDALKWLFYKLTHSRVLYDDELRHLGSRLLNTNDLPASKTFGSHRGDPSSPNFTRIRIEKKDKKNKFAPFFYWYFEAIELIMDKSENTVRSKESKSAKEERLTMASLFQSGMILGFISRTGSEELLRACNENAMIIRFSDHFSGHMTVSYINKENGDRHEKLEHVRPLARNFLKGMSLPLVVAMLINLDNVNFIITSRLAPGVTCLSSENLKNKMDLVKNHLRAFEGGIYSEDQYAYANIMLHASEKDSSQGTERPSSSRNSRTYRSSPPTPDVRKQHSKHDALLEKFRSHPRMLELVEELAKSEASSGFASPASVSPWPYNQTPSPYASSNPSVMSQMVPSPNPSQFYNQPQSSSTVPSATTFGQQTPIIPSQHPQMPMPYPSAQGQSSFLPTTQMAMQYPPTNQATMSFQPTPQMAMQYQPTNPATMPFQSNNGVQMMSQQPQQQQTMMMQGGQHAQWNVHPQAQHSNANVMQGYNQPQQIQMELQQMTIGSQQQQRTFTTPVNQFPQPQGMMQQSPLSHTGHQQAIGQHASQSQNAQAQMMPQQQMSSSSSYVQQPQQGMMQSSFGYQPQQQYYPQYQSQPGAFMQQPFGGNMQTLQQQQQQQQMLPNFQNPNSQPRSDDDSEQDCRGTSEDDDINNQYEPYHPSIPKVSRKY